LIGERVSVLIKEKPDKRKGLSGMTDAGPIDLGGISRGELEAMLDAGARVLESRRVLANTGDNIVGELLRDATAFYEWNHYPEGDVFDPRSNSQYYYHAHPKDQRPGEHGHFHTFLRPKGMPAGIEPAPVPNYQELEGENDALSHLIAISCDKQGEPIKLFTTNRWVTGEIWYRAADVIRMLDCFQIDHVRPSWAVNIWLTNMLILFRPQIRALIEERDRVVAKWAADHDSADVYEDRALEVTSEFGISVESQIAALAAAVKGQAAE
jgi:hypothetical protein